MLDTDTSTILNSTLAISYWAISFMGVRFGAYEKTYSTDSVASMSVAFVACVVSAFVMHFIITLVQPLFFKGSMSWTLIATITIGFFVGLATSLGCL